MHYLYKPRCGSDLLAQRVWLQGEVGSAEKETQRNEGEGKAQRKVVIAGPIKATFVFHLFCHLYYLNVHNLTTNPYYHDHHDGSSAFTGKVLLLLQPHSRRRLHQFLHPDDCRHSGYAFVLQTQCRWRLQFRG